MLTYFSVAGYITDVGELMLASFPAVSSQFTDEMSTESALWCERKL